MKSGASDFIVALWSNASQASSPDSIVATAMSVKKSPYTRCWGDITPYSN